MPVFTIVKALNMNTANRLQQAQQYTGITNVAITQENEAYNDHQTINSGGIKAQSTTHHIILAVAQSAW